MWVKMYTSKREFDADKDAAGATPEETQQVRAARQAAAFLYQSGAIGTDDAVVRILGEASAGHTPPAGAEEEMITVVVKRSHAVAVSA